MAKERTLKISCLNIRVHTQHKPEEYIKFWKKIMRLKIKSIRGNIALMIGTARQLEGSNKNLFFGYIYRFIDIDPSEPWFDIEKNSEASEEDVALVNIPEKLKPNLSEIPYVFNFKEHKMYFLSGGTDTGVGHHAISSLFDLIKNNPAIIKDFGEIDHTIVSDKKALEEMLNWPVIRRIYVKLERPNPTQKEDDESFYDRLQRRKLKSEEHIYTKAAGAETIEPDEEMKAIFATASENGVYRQDGINPQGESRQVSSKSYPMQYIYKYDPDSLIRSDAFIQAIAQI